MYTLTSIITIFKNRLGCLGIDWNHRPIGCNSACFVTDPVAVKGWKPFGRDNRENYWSKRPENEVLIALSNLYARMRSYPLVLANYYGYFRHKYGRFLTVTGPLQYRAVQTLSACERYIEGGSRNRKLLINLMRDLYKIEEEIRKGMKKIWN